MVALYANSGDPDQTLGSEASDLGLHCLTLLGVSRLQWVKKDHYLTFTTSGLMQQMTNG